MRRRGRGGDDRQDAHHDGGSGGSRRRGEAARRVVGGHPAGELCGLVLTAPCDGLPLGIFRAAFGLLSAVAMAHTLLLTDEIEIKFGWAELNFRYEFATEALLPVVSTAALTVVGWVAVAAAVCISTGVLYRPACWIYTASLLLQLLLEKTRYNNHYYFELLLGMLFGLTNADASLSLGPLLCKPNATRPPGTGCVPAWQLWAFRAQVVLCYFYAGLAKINTDWLDRGEPMATWMGSKPWLPSNSLCQALAAVFGYDDPDALIGMFYSFGGLAFDLLAGFALLGCCGGTADRAACRCLGGSCGRPVSVLMAGLMLAFHLTNAAAFNVGAFPWLMLAANVLFLLPAAKQPPAVLAPQGRGYWLRAAGAAVLTLATVVVPLRGYACQLWPAGSTGGTSWTGIGYHFSWRMMLHDERVLLRVMATGGGGGGEMLVAPLYRLRLTERQVSRGLIDPDCVRQLAAHVQRRLGPDTPLRLDGWRSVNFQPYQRWTDSAIELWPAELAAAAAEPGLLWWLWPAPPRWLVLQPFQISAPAMARVEAARRRSLIAAVTEPGRPAGGAMFFTDRAPGTLGFTLTANGRCSAAVRLTAIHLELEAVLAVQSTRTAPPGAAGVADQEAEAAVREGETVRLDAGQHHLIRVGGAPGAVAVWNVEWEPGCTEGGFHRAIDFFSREGRASL